MVYSYSACPLCKVYTQCLWECYTLSFDSVFTPAVELRSVDHVQAGPTPDSFVYIEGQNMTFVCNATPSIQALSWLVELTGQTTAGGALALANSQPRIETEVTANLVNPSNITILNAMLEDSNTTVTCKDANVGNIIDVATIYVEGKHCCICIYIIIILCTS